MRCERAFPVAAALMLALPPGATAGARSMVVSLCHGGTLTIPVPGSGRSPHDDGCAVACHAMCLRKSIDEDDDERL